MVMHMGLACKTNVRANVPESETVNEITYFSLRHIIVGSDTYF